MSIELKNITDKKLLKEHEQLLSEEISDFSGLIAEGFVSPKSKEKIIEKLRDLSNMRDQIRSALSADKSI